MPPLISDDTHTTRIPTDVDESTFGPLSLILPPPNDENQHGNIGYFVQKCRCVLKEFIESNDFC